LNGALTSVQLYFLDQDPLRGYAISHLLPAPAQPEDPLRLSEHLSGFVSHLDPKFLTMRARRRKAMAFGLKDFSHHDEIARIAGQSASVRVLSHRALTLRAARTAVVVNGKPVDLCVASWRLSIEEALPAVSLLTPQLAKHFDRHAEIATD
jgi:hypothetical protein